MTLTQGTSWPAYTSLQPPDPRTTTWPRASLDISSYHVTSSCSTCGKLQSRAMQAMGATCRFRSADTVAHVLALFTTGPAQRHDPQSDPRHGNGPAWHTPNPARSIPRQVSDSKHDLVVDNCLAEKLFASSLIFASSRWLFGLPSCSSISASRSRSSRSRNLSGVQRSAFWRAPKKQGRLAHSLELCQLSSLLEALPSDGKTGMQALTLHQQMTLSKAMSCCPDDRSGTASNRRSSAWRKTPALLRNCKLAMCQGDAAPPCTEPCLATRCTGPHCCVVSTSSSAAASQHFAPPGPRPRLLAAKT